MNLKPTGSFLLNCPSNSRTASHRWLAVFSFLTLISVPTPYLDRFRLHTSTAEYQQLNENQHERDSGQYHLTVFSPPEMELLDTDGIRTLIGLEMILQPLGVGKVIKRQNSVYFVVVECH